MNPLDDPNDLIQERVKKLKAIQALGIDPFGGKFPKTAFIQELVAGFEDQKPVQSAARITAMRFMGKSVFADLRDESGRIQVYIKKTELTELEAQVFDQLDLGDTIGVDGFLFKTKTGEISIHVKKLQILSKALRPMPEKWHGLKDVEERHRRRYLDLIANEDSREVFKKRSLAVRSIRRTLDDKGYLEVETPMMHPIPGGANGKPFETHHEALDLDLYLRVAPELYLKKLLVGGFDRVYEINKSFRNEGISTRHNPEFTMIEVYTAYHDVEDVMNLCEELIKNACQAIHGSLKTDFLDVSKWERVSFSGLMKDKFGILPDDPTEAWIQKLKKHGVNVEGKDLSRTQVINIVGDLLDEAVAGHGKRPVFVTEYFAELSPLARKNKTNPLIADRFELYCGGMEVANGYSEQNDPIEQRRRFLEELEGVSANDLSKRLDEDFLNALEHGMPPAGGLGIGIDRLVMLLTNQASIREVVLFPQMKPEGR